MAIRDLIPPVLQGTRAALKKRFRPKYSLDLLALLRQLQRYGEGAIAFRRPRTQKGPRASLALDVSVIAGGYCVGCGACGGRAGANLWMTWNGSVYLPAGDPTSFSEPRTIAVCPFSASAQNEDKLASDLFPRAVRHPEIGRYASCHAGYVIDKSQRAASSSGGLTSWMLNELLRRDLVDAVIHSKPRTNTESNSRLFAYHISRNEAELREGVKSHYYPNEISEVMSCVRATPGRYAFVGVPCVVKAVRLLMADDPLLRERVQILVGLFCGHMKSAGFAEALAWEAGIPPEQLVGIDFRVKVSGRPASHYAFTSTYKDPQGRVVTKEMPMSNTSVFDWGTGWFRLYACEFCDDVTAETADISFGDAWLPEYVNDLLGTNIVVCRDARFTQILTEGAQSGVIQVHPLSADRVAKSQTSGLSHRRKGLAYRLWLKQQAGEWSPPKRVRPSWWHLSRNQRRIFEARTAISIASFKAFAHAKAAGNLELFHDEMAPLLRRYNRLGNGIRRHVGSFADRVVRRLAIAASRR